MKKLIAIVILIAGLFVGFSTDAANPNNENLSGFIHYQVKISTFIPFGQSICPSVVAITNGNGQLIGNYIPYRPYMDTYDFYESGPVNGTRIARVMVVPFDDDNVCVMAPDPMGRNTTFSNGQTYRFNMIYGIKPLPAIEPIQQKQ